MNAVCELGVPSNRITHLKQWSDVVYLIWQHLRQTSETQETQGSSTADLNHVFRYNVTNEETKDRMMDAMGHAGPPPDWPGLQWSICDERAKALLNTSNAVGVSWLLAQHKAPAQLGLRVVDKVGIFSCQAGGGPAWNMYFHVVAGPLGPGKLK